MGEHIAIERIQAGIMDIGREYTFFKVVEHHDPGDAAQPAESLLVQFGPDARAGLEAEKPDALAAEAERQHEQTRAPVLAGLPVADHRAGPVIDLRFLARSSKDDPAGFQRLRSAQFANVTLHALISATEAVLVDQFLPDRHRIPAMRQARFDEFAIRLAGTGGGTWRGFQLARVGGHPATIGRFCRRGVGGHLIRIGRFCRWLPPTPASRLAHRYTGGP
jgi:hypothetical protein